MNNTNITLNVKTPVKLRDVTVIERVNAADRDRLVAKTGLPPERFEAFQSNLRFIDGANMLVTQSFEEIAARAGHRLVIVGTEKVGGKLDATRLVPMDAIRHVEFLTRADLHAMKARYKETDPSRIDALKTRIVYFGLDPASVEAGKPSLYRKMFPVDLRYEIKGLQKLDLVDIGHSRFLLASEIMDAKNLSEAELQSLSRKYNLKSDKDGDLTTSITLRGGDLIMSSVPGEEIARRAKAMLPSCWPVTAKPAPAGKAAPAPTAK